MAPAELLRELPDTILIYPCEFDGLQVEAAAFRERLEQESGKKVRWKEVTGVPHGWDKSPNPFRTPCNVNEFYRDACNALRVAFEIDTDVVSGVDVEVESTLDGEGKVDKSCEDRKESRVDEAGLDDDEMEVDERGMVRVGVVA